MCNQVCFFRPLLTYCYKPTHLQMIIECLAPSDLKKPCLIFVLLRTIFKVFGRHLCPHFDGLFG